MCKGHEWRLPINEAEKRKKETRTETKDDRNMGEIYTLCSVCGCEAAISPGILVLQKYCVKRFRFHT